jgi:hypothetical protein
MHGYMDVKVSVWYFVSVFYTEDAGGRFIANETLLFTSLHCVTSKYSALLKEVAVQTPNLIHVQCLSLLIWKLLIYLNAFVKFCNETFYVHCVHIYCFIGYKQQIVSHRRCSK